MRSRKREERTWVMVRIPRDVAESIDTIAVPSGRSRQFLIEKALRDYVRRHGKARSCA